MEYTLVVEQNGILLVDGRQRRSRLLFRSPQVVFYVRGALGKKWEIAANIACHKVIELGGRAIDLRRADG